MAPYITGNPTNKGSDQLSYKFCLATSDYSDHASSNPNHLNLGHVGHSDAISNFSGFFNPLTSPTIQNLDEDDPDFLLTLHILGPVIVPNLAARRGFVESQPYWTPVNLSKTGSNRRQTPIMGSHASFLTLGKRIGGRERMCNEDTGNDFHCFQAGTIPVSLPQKNLIEFRERYLNIDLHVSWFGVGTSSTCLSRQISRLFVNIPN